MYRALHPLRTHRPKRQIRLWPGLQQTLFILLTLWLLVTLTGGLTLRAAAETPAHVLPASASCSQLAHVDPTATNSTQWGVTVLPGFGQAGGWFGVPVCSNAVNLVALGGANVSCDVAPTNFVDTGCAPGSATADGYGLSFQCVELVARFSAWAFGDAPGAWQGDAPYLWLSGHHPIDFTAYLNGGFVAPQPGDILVWGTVDSQGRPWPAGPAGGHVAVVAAVGHGSMTFVEENMLGHHDGQPFNIPSETTTLTKNSMDQWTIGPTYGTNGGRALYGWLHSSRNTGHFPATVTSGMPTPPAPPTSAQPSPTPPTPALRPTATPAITTPASPTTPETPGAPGTQGTTPPLASAVPELPSLARGLVVTEQGVLAELVWSDTHTPTRSPEVLPTLTPIASPTTTPKMTSPTATIATTTSPSTPVVTPAPPVPPVPPQVDSMSASISPHAMLESLGAPSGIALAAPQTPATILLPTGERYAFVRGQDGNLYAAYTPTHLAGVMWQPLGAPTGIALTSSVTAVWSPKEGLLVGALGSDGEVWLRSGPPGMLGDWITLGRPAAAQLQSTLLIQTSGPAGGDSSAPMPSPTVTATTSRLPSENAVRREALAIGTDGEIYNASWHATPAASIAKHAETSTTPNHDTRDAQRTIGTLATEWSDWHVVTMSGSASLPPLRTLYLANPPNVTSGAIDGTTGILLVAADTTGGIWLLTCSQVSQTWTAMQLQTPMPMHAVLATTSLPAEVESAQAQVPSTPLATPFTQTQTTLHIYFSADIPAQSNSRPQSPQQSPKLMPMISATGNAINQATHYSSARHEILLGSYALSPRADGTLAATAISWYHVGEATPGSTTVETSLPAPSSLVPWASLESPATILALGSHESALLLPQGDAAWLVGGATAMQQLAPAFPPTGGAPPMTEGSPDFPTASTSPDDPASGTPGITPGITPGRLLGSVPSPEAFSDNFGGGDLDGRWLLTDVSSSAQIAATPAAVTSSDVVAPTTQAVAAQQVTQVTQGEFTLALPPMQHAAAPSASDARSIAALQGAPPAAFTLTVHLTPGTGWAASADAASKKQVGLLLQLDDWHRVTLALHGDETVTLCSYGEQAISSQAPLCSITAIPAGSTETASTEGIYLRVQQTGSTISGWASIDGVQWILVGMLTVAWLPSPGSVVGAYAPPTSATAPVANASTPDSNVANSANTPGYWTSWTSVGLFLADQSTAQVSANSGGVFSARFSAFQVDTV